MSTSLDPAFEHGFDEYLAKRVSVVDKFLDEYLPPEDEKPETLSRAVRYSLFAGGKRFRPVLVLASAEAVGGSLKAALPAAAAFEMIHTYSLVHDDLPAMDDDSLRRGKPTSHIVFGDAIAILAGDALQTHAFELLANYPAAMSDTNRLRALSILALASGVQGMVAGQVVDLESEGKSVGAEELEYIHCHKTGALIRAACECGAVVGNASVADTRRLVTFGTEIGLAFQIIDDILDVEGDAETLGKSAGKDVRAGKATYPHVHGIELARREASLAHERALEAISALDERAEPLRRLADQIVARKS